MRQANEDDLDFLVDGYVKIACHMKAGEQDFYIARLPEAPDETIRTHVARYVGREDALTCWRKSKARPSLAYWPASAAHRSRRHVSVSRGTSQSAGSSRKIAGRALRLSWSVPPKIGFVKRKWESSSFHIWSRTNWPRSPGNDWATDPSEFLPTRNCRMLRIHSSHNFCLHLAVSEKFRYQAAQKASEARRAKFDELRRTLQYVEASRASATTHMRLFEPPSRFPIPARGSPT